MKKSKILVVDDETAITDLCERILSPEQYSVEVFNDPKKALDIIKQEYFDLVVSDFQMPGMTGIELLKSIKLISNDTGVIIMTGYGTIETAVESIKFGAYDFITKPFEIEYFNAKISHFFSHMQLSFEVKELKEIVNLYEVSKAMVSSLGLKQLLDLIIKLACETLNADSGSILLLDKQTNELKLESCYGWTEENILNFKMKLGEQVAGWVAEKKESLLLVDGLDKYPQFAHLKPRPEIKVSMVVSMKLKNREDVIGVMTLNVLRNSRKFTENDLRLFSLFATNASLAINDAKVYEQIKELDKLKTEFISNVSHELRTPLMAINGAIELLYPEINKGNSQILNLLNICKRNVEKINKMILELLDFSRLEMNLMKINKTNIIVNSIINEVISDTEIIIKDKNIKLKTQIPEQSYVVNADADRIKQVLLNLIGNAIKFSPDGGEITVKISSEKQNDVNYAVLSVRDNGIGIAPENQIKIFEKFYQVDGSTTRKVAGIGLGLALSKEIVELHGGRIWVDSIYGKGSTFFFTLPLTL